LKLEADAAVDKRLTAPEQPKSEAPFRYSSELKEWIKKQEEAMKILSE
jgi:hypothetical protein